MRSVEEEEEKGKRNETKGTRDDDTTGWTMKSFQS